MLFTGNANPNLSKKIAQKLDTKISDAKVERFSDGEICVEIKDNVRGQDIFIIQSTCPPNTNDNIMELAVMADALRRSSASRITAVIPYFGYARQDRRVRSQRVPITARVVADIIASVGIDRVLTVDLHADQIQGFFSIPVDNVYASPVLLEDINKRRPENLIVVSPDVGGVVRARAIAKRLNDADLAIIDKRRPGPNQTEVMNIIGEVKGKSCVIIDDIVDTGGTLCQAATALKGEGANQVYAYCTHAVLSGKAIDNITNSQLDELVTTDTIPLNTEAQNCKKIRQLGMDTILAECIERISQEKSISTLFD